MTKGAPSLAPMKTKGVAIARFTLFRKVLLGVGGSGSLLNGFGIELMKAEVATMRPVYKFPNRAKGLGCTGGKRGKAMGGLGVLIVGVKVGGGVVVRVGAGTIEGAVVTTGDTVVGNCDGVADVGVVTFTLLKGVCVTRPNASKKMNTCIQQCFKSGLPGPKK
jgi:hypothetical protein